MPAYVPFSPDVEDPEPDEAETHSRIVELMTEGMHLVKEKNDGRAIRISHAKAHGLVKGELCVHAELPPELAQGLFQPGAVHQVLARISHAPGELVDDAKVSTPRGFAMKIFGVEGAHLPPFKEVTTQDFVFDTGKEFINGGAKAFLQSFKPNAKLAPRLPNTAKGLVSDTARGAYTALRAVGVESPKLDFYGHPKRHPTEESYFSQTPYRYGEYIAKLGIIPNSPRLLELQGLAYDPEAYNALREDTVAFFQTHPAEFDVVVQLNTNLEKMPIEDATVPWSEAESPYRSVGRLVFPVQEAYSTARKEFVEARLSFCPAHSLVAHQPLGSINRARLVVYTALATLRRTENSQPTDEPVDIENIPD